MDMPYTTYQKYYVAFLDLLGFKAMICKQKLPPSEAVKIFQSYMRNQVACFLIERKHPYNPAKIQKKVMSDSICFYIDYNEENALADLVATCLSFQTALLRRKNPILTRGAIVSGEMFADGDIMFGPALIHAYMMEEKYAHYPRIILDAETLKTGRLQAEDTLQDFITDSIFWDDDNLYVLNCYADLVKRDSSGTDCSRLLSYIDEVLASSVDNSVREKYTYLMDNLLKWYTP